MRTGEVVVIVEVVEVVVLVDIKLRICFWVYIKMLWINFPDFYLQMKIRMYWIVIVVYVT